ncbi:uncharacterized protein YecE (DUF72 family) [Sphingopyxis panaciterrae]|uniref:DUF72 domain-containing protein n=1 Tax=Sphingopyxis panaciterrae TaxID=363841 RepID=UPI00141DDE70|nr:DUF72 domain-containing protein [Sphingopyxis panaciterrae]NIJ38389.1 uncharacterized protein YecE (DUF72 family) [Sphingopyxis panaciterrae]
MSFRVGTAGWSIASQYADRFPCEGIALERYAARFSCVEVNSSFYRSHRPATWSRWGAIVPDDFRFAVKVPRAITHHRGLANCDELIARLLAETSGLGAKLAVLLVQLPPKLAYRSEVADAFFRELSAATPAHIVCEPRHPSWFEPEPDKLLQELEVARVAADPARVPAAATPGGWRGLSYWRLHGSPVIYRSPYGAARLDNYAGQIASERRAAAPAWCIFDNTAAMAALDDAFGMAARLASIEGDR